MNAPGQRTDLRTLNAYVSIVIAFAFWSVSLLFVIELGSPSAMAKDASYDSAEIIRMLRAQEQASGELAVEFTGVEVYPAGSLTATIEETATIEGKNANGDVREQVSVEPYPAEDHTSDLSVSWRVRINDRLSRLQKRSSIFNTSSIEFHPHFVDSFCDPNRNAFWDFEPVEDNSHMAYQIAANTPEYFEYNTGNMQTEQSGALATALFAAVGRLTYAGGNALIEPELNAKHITAIQTVGENSLRFSISASAGFRTDVTCEVRGHRALVRQLQITLGGQPYLEVSLGYDTDGIVDALAYAYYSSGELELQADLKRVDGSLERTVSKNDVVFEGVPVGGIIRSGADCFIIDTDNRRIPFNPYIPRNVDHRLPLEQLVIFGLVLLVVVVWFVYRGRKSVA